MANFLIDHEYTLDITPSARPQLVPVSEYDVGRIFTFTLKHNGEEMTIPSSYGAVTVEGTIGSYAFSESASIENGKIVFQLTESMTAHAGKAWTKIKFSNADAPVSSCAFILAVDRAGVEADTVIGADGFDKRIDDAVDNRVDEVIGDYIPVDVVSAAVSDWMDDHPEVIADPDLYTVKVKSHHYDGVGDTSWILLKIPRAQFKLSFHNCSGDDTDNPEVKESDPKTWLENHLSYFLSHNLAFSGKDEVSWGYRWDGAESFPTTSVPLDHKRPRNFFAVDTDTEEYAFYNSCTLPITGDTDEEKIASIQARYAEAGSVLHNIPSRYDMVFACGDPFVLNGVSNTDSFNLDNDKGTRTAFGWDDDYYYVLSAEGRGTYERGLTLDEVKAIFVAHGVANAVNFDGGGSVCLAARIGGTVEKINRFRDCSLSYPELRAVGLCAAYERRSGE